MQYFQLTINDQCGQRVDNFILSYFKTPKALIYRLLRKKYIRINKKKIKHYYRLQFGDILTLPVFLSANYKKSNLSICADHLRYLESLILHEDDNYLVINKPSGMAVHGGSGICSGLIERLRLLRPNVKKLELAHRLDKDTSGCIIITKKYSVLLSFHLMFKNHSIKKIYLAVVYGLWPAEITKIDLPISKTNINHCGKMMHVDFNKGKKSVTFIKVLKYFKNFTLLKVIPYTGRTHQIRIHLSSCHHPIVFDEKYGFKMHHSINVNIKNRKYLLLHAHVLMFKDPITNLYVKITSPFTYDDFNIENYNAL